MSGPWPPIVLGILAGLVAFSVARFLGLLYGELDPAFLAWVCAIAAAEAVVSERIVKAKELGGGLLVRFRAVELLAFFMVLRAGSYLGEGWGRLVTDVRQWPSGPWRLVDLESAIGFVLVVSLWRASTLTFRDLGRLGDPEAGTGLRVMGVRMYVPPLESIAGRLFWAGGLMVILSGVVQAGLEAAIDLDRPIISGIPASVLAYFLIGFVGYSRLRLLAHLESWSSEGVDVSDHLAEHWTRYATAFIGLALLLALVLPIGPTVGLAQVVGAVARLLGSGLVALLLLLGAESALPSAPPEPPPPPLPPADPSVPPTSFAPPPPVGDGGWVEIPQWVAPAWSVLFWVMLVAMAGYVVVTYFRDRPRLFSGLQRSALLLGASGIVDMLRRLLEAIRAAWRWLDGDLEWGGETERAPGRLDRIRARRLRRYRRSPRQRILSAYLDTVRRAGRVGLAREPAQTPAEYLEGLKTWLPGVERPAAELTESFLEARFSLHVIEPTMAERSEADASVVRAALWARSRDFGRCPIT